MSSDKCTALMIVDAQVNMFDPTCPAADADVLLERLTALVARARAAGVPVVFVRNAGGEADPDLPGTPGWELHPALQPAAHEIIVDKSTCDTFESTPIDAHLRAAGVTEVVIAGLQSEYCIRATTLGALAHGYAVTLVEDAHGTYDFGGKRASTTIAEINDELRDRVALVPTDEIAFA